MGVTLVAARAGEHHVQHRQVAERGDRDVIEPLQPRQRDGLRELLARAVEPVPPQRGLAEHRVHERLTRVVAAAAVRRGLREQLVGGLDRALEVAVQPGGGEPGQRHRLQVAAAARSRDARGRGLGVREVQLRRVGVADVERRAGERGGELGVGPQPLGRERGGERPDGGRVAAHVELEPVLGDDLDGEVPVARGQRVLERVEARALVGVPARRARVQLRQLGRDLALGADAHEPREQSVVAEPLPVRVDAQHEPVGALERGERIRPVTVSGHGVGEASAHALDERRAQQEPAQPRGLAVEHLREQVVPDHPVVAGELRDERLGIVVALQAQGSEPQSRAPALGACVQRAHQVLGEVEAVDGEQFGRPPRA